MRAFRKLADALTSTDWDVLEPKEELIHRWYQLPEEAEQMLFANTLGIIIELVDELARIPMSARTAKARVAEDGVALRTRSARASLGTDVVEHAETSSPRKRQRLAKADATGLAVLTHECGNEAKNIISWREGAWLGGALGLQRKLSGRRWLFEVSLVL